MIRNYLLIALRNVQRQLSYSVINIVGLAIGIACSLVIILYVYGEWSYDRHFSNGARIYRIGISFFNIGNFASGPEELFEVLPKEFDGIELATRVEKDRNVIITAHDTEFKEAQVYYADSSFFQIFEYSFKSGDSRKVLRGPNEVVVTESIAQKYFGHTDVLGQVLEVGKEKIPYTITGVVTDPTYKTQFTAPVWISIQTKITRSHVWSSAAFYNYVLLRENVAEADLKTALNSVFEKHVYPESGKLMGFKSLEDYRKNENAIKFHVHNLRDIYLKSKLNAEISPGGNESSIYIFSAISFFILLLAAVNFVNLTTARASRRAKEVGIRKTMGTSRGRLVGQFLLESVMTSTVSMLLALVLAQGFLLTFEYITGSPLLTTIWRNPFTVFLFFGFSILVGLLSGIYPAYYLTAFQPVKVLKGNLMTGGGQSFRNALVVVQFSVSIILIVCSAFVLRQLNFMQTKDLGFDQENVLTIDNCSILGTHAEAFKNELTAQSGVLKSSYHVGEPGSKRILTFMTYQTPKMQNSITLNTYFGDVDYISLLGMHVVKGRGFSKDLLSDTAGVILNEAAVKALDLGDDPIGAVVNEKQKVIGVVSDFHWESLRTSIGPVAIMLNSGKNQLGFKLAANAAPGFLKVVEAKWKQMFPDEAIQYHFVDENFGELVKKENVFGKAITFFTLLAIFISCLGLYGLSAYTAEQKTKEIGIRKVMGASSSNIIMMLNRKFTLLVLIAAFISVPASYFIAEQWLQGFAYKVSMGAGIFVFSIAASLLIAWITVSFHSLKASWINPAETLKYE